MNNDTYMNILSSFKVFPKKKTPKGPFKDIASVPDQLKEFTDAGFKVFSRYVRFLDDKGNLLPKGGVTFVFSIGRNSLLCSYSICSDDDLFCRKKGVAEALKSGRPFRTLLFDNYGKEEIFKLVNGGLLIVDATLLYSYRNSRNRSPMLKKIYHFLAIDLLDMIHHE